MRKMQLGLLAALFFFNAMTAGAQTNLAGRTYHNANIMADVMKDATKDLDKIIAEAKAKKIAETEKKKGRKLTKAELDEIDKTAKQVAEQAEAMKKGLKTAVTVEFKDAQKIVLKADMKISDDALKAAGYGWLKRKALKAALAVAPSSEKGTYVVKGKQVIMTDGDGEKDTLRLSDDGKYLYGKLDKTDFKLTRTK